METAKMDEKKKKNPTSDDNLTKLLEKPLECEK